MAKVNFARLASSNSDDAFIEAIASIKRRGETLQLDIHLYLVAVATRWAKSGDVRPAVKMVNLLLEEMPGGVRANAIRIWVEKRLGFVFNAAAQEFVDGKVKAKDLVIKDLANARWWEETPEPDYRGMDFSAQLLTLVKNGEKRLAHPNTLDKIDRHQVVMARAIGEGKPLNRAELVAMLWALSDEDRASIAAAVFTAHEQVQAATHG